jgi:hypothetical protein
MRDGREHRSQLDDPQRLSNLIFVFSLDDVQRSQFCDYRYRSGLEVNLKDYQSDFVKSRNEVFSSIK